MRNDDGLVARLALHQSAAFLTVREKRLVLGNIGSPSDIAALSKDDMAKIVGRRLGRAAWNGNDALAACRNALRVIRAFGIGCTGVDFDDYPAMLREMSDPPYLLFYRGNLAALGERCVSVVGTRRATVGARRAAETFAKDAAEDGWTVVSGLAYGIDIASHRGALLARRGVTAAVLPCGVDTIVPSAHTRVATRIVERGGLLLSEYVPGTPAAAFRFVQRNRIIAALSAKTLVVQAPAGSGAMITAAFALDYNRNVMFHKEAFSCDAQELNRVEVERIKKEISAGKKREAALENTPEAFVRDGASVIGSFAQFRELR